MVPHIKKVAESADRLKPVEESPRGLFLIVPTELLALLPFPVILRDYAFAAPGP
jgi:hypothetical protein